MTATLVPFDDRQGWLAARRQGIGASDVAGILGLSPWASPWSVWAEKVGLVEDEDEPSERMEFGTRAEPMLAAWFQDRTGLFVVGQQLLVHHSNHPWQLCTVDGLVSESPASDEADVLGVAEWKTTREDEWAEVPPHYQCQATWSSIVTGHDHVWFGVLHMAFGRPAFRVYEFDIDADDRAYVLERVTAFWEDHVLTGVPPAADGSAATADALLAAFTVHDEGESAEVDPRDWALRRALMADINAREEQKQEVSNRLAAALGSAEVGTVGGVPVLSYRSQVRRSECPNCGFVKESQPFRVFRAKGER